MCVCNRKQDQVAKAVLNLPYYITNKILDSIGSAETNLGHPPSCMEVLAEVKHKYPSVKIDHVNLAMAIIASLIREDWLFVDDEG